MTIMGKRGDQKPEEVGKKYGKWLEVSRKQKAKGKRQKAKGKRCT